MAVEYVNSLTKKKAGIKVISKTIKPDVIGINDELPEGIFGILDMPDRPKLKIKKSKVGVANSTPIKKPKTASKLDASTVPPNLTKSEKTVDASSASVPPKKKKKIASTEPRIIGMAPISTETPAPPKKSAKIVIDTTKVEEPKKKKKKRKKLTVAPITQPPPKRVVRSSNVMPKLEINYGNMMPPEAEGLSLDNVVRIPDDILKRVARKTERRTQELSKLLLDSSAPAMLSYDAASNYVKAALSDGLKIDVEIDRGVLEVVKDMARLDVVFFYLKRLALPQSMKKRFMKTFVDELSKASLETMHKTNKSDAVSSQLRELEAVVMKRSEHQAREQNAKTRSSKRIGLTTEDGTGAGPSGTKKTRRDPPMMGGF